MAQSTTSLEEIPDRSRRKSGFLALGSRLSLEWRTILTGLALFAVFFALMAVVQFSTTDLADNDGFYHIKFAYLMRTQGLKPHFPWLPLTILNPREFYDHHFLFHVALIPFTFGDMVRGAKWASILFSSLAFLSVWWLLHSHRIRYAALWSFGLLAVSEAFLYRMSIPRVQSFSLAVLALGLNWLLGRQYTRLLPLAFLYVWLYDAFPLLLLLTALTCLAEWLIEHRLEARPLLFAAVGTFLGLVINPYFPHDVLFILRHLLPKLTETTAVNVGSEWYPYQTTQLMENSPLALVAFLMGVLALGLQERRMDLRTASTFFAAVLFGAMLFQARRFIEYFPAFALIFAAFAWHPLLDDRPTLLVSPWRKPFSLLTNRSTLSAVALVLCLLPGTWLTLKDAQTSMKTSKPYQLYEQASFWLQENTPAGARVFQTDWDDFPRLFYYNTHNTYLIGLDPTYLQLYNPDLYDLWVKITRGEVESPSHVIATRFAARYIITDLKHQAFIDMAGQDPGLQQVFRDGEAIVYQVVE